MTGISTKAGITAAALGVVSAPVLLVQYGALPPEFGGFLPFWLADVLALGATMLAGVAWRMRGI